jgi:hypothetical protein
MDHRRQGSHCETVADRRTSKLLDRKGDVTTGARSSGCRIIRNDRERNGIRVKLITASVGVGQGVGVDYGGVVALAVLEGGEVIVEV